MVFGIKLYIIASILCFQTLGVAAKDYPVSLFNIYSDGITLNTRSIQFAIDYINQQGGGRLVFDVGRFLTGSIHLKSNVTIHLLEGAVLLGSLNPFEYDKEGLTALVLAKDQQNIGITGKGIIDGQGRQVARNVAALVHEGLIKDLFRNDRPEVEIRPMLIYFRSCNTVSIKGITLHNAAAWIQTYDQCKNINIDSLTVESRAFWNNDGFDIVDCDSASITNCYINTADDGICLKSHDPGKVCQNILIRNCTIRSSANAIKFGTASLGGFRNISIMNNTIFDTYRSALALEAVDGGFIEHVEVDSLVANNTGNGIFLRIGERVSGKVGRIQDISIRHVSIDIATSKPDSGYDYEGPIEDMPRNISPAIIITGMESALISGITMDGITIKHPGSGNPMFANAPLNKLDSIAEKKTAYPEYSMFKELPAWGVYIRHARDIKFSDFNLWCNKKDYRTGVVVDDVHHSAFTSIHTKEPGSKKSFYQQRSSELIFE